MAGAIPDPQPLRAGAPAGGYTLAYGRIDDPGTAVAQEAAAMRAAGARLSPRLARIDPADPPLRLNTPGWLQLPPSALTGIVDSRNALHLAGKMLENRTPVFAAPQRAFLATYAAFVAARIEAARDRLRRKLAAAGFAPDAGFPDYWDWALCAPLPLPNVHLGSHDAAGTPPDFVRFDIVFWTKGEVLALRLGRLTMPAPRAARAMERLGGARHVRIMHLAVSSGPTGDRLDEALASRIGDFWEDCDLPFGLFRPHALRARADEQGSPAIGWAGSRPANN